MNEQKTRKALLSLGSNLGEREQYLCRARTAIASRHRIVRQSRELNNAALIVTEQPDFLNQIIEIETTDSPEELLLFLKEIERDLGRMHRERYGPREIDLDILIFEDVQMQTDFLRLPHPGLIDRAYLHVLLAEPPFTESEKARHIDAARKGMLSTLLLPLGLFIASVAFVFLPADGVAAPIVPAEALPEALPVHESGSFYYRSPASVDAQEQKAYAEALQLHYADFQNDLKSDFKKLEGRSFDASLLNDLAVIAAEDNDLEGAEALFRLSLSRKDALPTRLNLIFLYLSQNIEEAGAMLAELQLKLSDERRLAVLQALRIRRFDVAADRFLRSWMQAEGLLPLSPSLKKAAKETAALFETMERKKEALLLYQEIDSRSGGTDSDVVSALARLTEDVLKDRDLALSLYRRLLTLNTAVDDEDLRHYAQLLFKSGDFAGVEQALKRLKRPSIDDIRLRITARLRLDPDADVDALIEGASSVTGSRPRTLFLVNDEKRPGQPSLFDGLLLNATQATLKGDLPYTLRMEFFGSADPATIAEDRRIQQGVY
ncbi:2-amino-4-hydroxy-6-hydroxymethyldihydropteridine diphosphokinase [Leptonema illini]|nr:2-amino-4-hydroxy-6-hydroxymethyldihydropteridine diphosphokinase [Leptonema illini]